MDTKTEKPMSRNDPIVHAGTETLSFCQIDRLNDLPKGAAFRLFKASRPELLEGHDYFYLPASSNAQLIDSLKATSQVYAATVNLVLLTPAGYAKLQGKGASADSAT